MKLSSLIVTASLALNAALLTILLVTHRPSGKAPARSATATRPASPGEPSSGQNGPTGEAPSPEQLSTALKSGDHIALRDQLRALGLAESTVQMVLRAVIWQPYYDRQREILQGKQAENLPYWRGLPQNTRNAYTAEERAELRTLASSLREKLQDVLGLPGLDINGTRAQRYAFLSPESAAKLADLDRDYGEMRQEINQESDRFKVPSDAEKLKFIEKERRKDLEAILSPSELAEYDLRYSHAALTLRSRLRDVELTETEYRDLFDLQKAYLDSLGEIPRFTSANGQRPSAEQLAKYESYRKNHALIGQEMLGILGPQRYEAFRRAQDPDYRQLQAAADRFNLPPETINAVYALRDTASAETQRIAANEALTPEQKKQALATLAGETREKVVSTLGTEIATAYLDKNMKWLERVQNGSTVTFSETDNRASFKPVASPKRATQSTTSRPSQKPAPAPQTGASPTTSPTAAP